MRKAVLLSINPKWCGKIAATEKTLEIRKSKPKMDVRSHNAFDLCGDGKVIGEFVCDRVYQYTTTNMDGADISENDVVSQSCLSLKELDAYEHSAEPKENCIYLLGLYCWHITDVKIYERPLDLSKIWNLNKAPQSWRYVEEVATL